MPKEEEKKQWRGGSVRPKAEVWVVVDMLERKWLEKKCGKFGRWTEGPGAGLMVLAGC